MSQLFKPCVIYLNPSADQVQSDSLKKRIQERGGKVAKSMGDKSVTHIVSTLKVDEKLSAGKKVVNPMWVLDSLKTNLLIPERRYAVETQLLYNKIFTTTGLRKPMRELIVSIVQIYGGEYSPKYTERTTHVIHNIADDAGAPSKKLEEARRSQSKEVIGLDEFLDWITKKQEQQLEAMKSKFKIFEGMDFFVYFRDKELQRGIETNIGLLGGKVVQKFTKGCYIVTPWRTTARIPEKYFVTGQWVEDCLNAGEFIEPDSNRLIYHSLPLTKEGPQYRKWVMTVTGFKDSERYDLIYLINGIGATYTGNLAQHVNTHIIYKTPEGQKYEKADEWDVERVTYQWFIDTVTQWFDKNTKQLEKETGWEEEQQSDDEDADDDDDGDGGNPKDRKRRRIEDDDDSQKDAMQDDEEQTPAAGANGAAASKGKAQDDDVMLIDDDEPAAPSTTPHGNSPLQYVFAFSSFKDEKQKQSLIERIQKLGGSVASTASDREDVTDHFTHLIVGGDVRKKPNVLLALAQGNAVIVKPDYVLESAKQGKFLDASAFVPQGVGQNAITMLSALAEWQKKKEKPFSGKVFVNLLGRDDETSVLVDRIISFGGGRSVQLEEIGSLEPEAAILGDHTTEDVIRKAKNTIKGFKLVKLAFIVDYLIHAGNVSIENYLPEAMN